MQEFLSSLLKDVGKDEVEPTSAAPKAATCAKPKPEASHIAPPSPKPEQPPLQEPAEPALLEQAACVLSIRLRGNGIDASLEWSDQSLRSIGAEFDRAALTALMRQALREEKGAHRLGQELSRRLPSAISQALSQVPKAQRSRCVSQPRSIYSPGN